MPWAYLTHAKPQVCKDLLTAFKISSRSQSSREASRKKKLMLCMQAKLQDLYDASWRLEKYNI